MLLTSSIIGGEVLIGKHGQKYLNDKEIEEVMKLIYAGKTEKELWLMLFEELKNKLKQ